MNLFHAVNASGCDTFLRVDDIVSIVHNDAEDLVLVGMRNGEQYGFSGDVIRNIYNEAFPSRHNKAFTIEGKILEEKTLAVQLSEIISMVDKWVV